MTAEADDRREPEQLPIAPAATRDAALRELERLGAFVQSLDDTTWSRPSAAGSWTLGDVVAHLNLALSAYSRVIDTVLAGGGAGGAWKAFGTFTRRTAPLAAPAFNAINSAIPKVMDRALSPNVLKAQFEDAATRLRARLERIGPGDYSRPVYYLGGPWPLSFFLATVTNEIAIHHWDMASRVDPAAHLSAEARAVLPWFYWSATSWMLRPPNTLSGTVQVILRDPEGSMWWTVGTPPRQGRGTSHGADATISAEAGTFVLTVAGRLQAIDALRSTSLSAEGNGGLAHAFLAAWHIV